MPQRALSIATAAWVTLGAAFVLTAVWTGLPPGDEIRGLLPWGQPAESTLADEALLPPAWMEEAPPAGRDTPPPTRDGHGLAGSPAPPATAPAPLAPVASAPVESAAPAPVAAATPLVQVVAQPSPAPVVEAELSVDQPDVKADASVEAPIAEADATVEAPLVEADASLDVEQDGAEAEADVTVRAPSLPIVEELLAPLFGG